MNISVKNPNKLFLDGLKIGFLLQLGSIGPTCMLLFRLSLSLPIGKLLAGVMAVTLSDAIYVTLTVLLISAIRKKMQRYRRTFDIVAGIALIAFGIFFITAGRTIDSGTFQRHDLFLWLFGLNIANPLAILFMTGIFSLELSKRNTNLKQSCVFASGFLLAIPIFMTFVILIGNLAGKVFPESIAQTINIAMGFVLVFLGVKNIFFKDKKLKSILKRFVMELPKAGIKCYKKK
jgi:threonine/homoserine/homoserine lactone efflux protein